MRLVVTGAGGMLGQDVVRAARAVSHDPVPLPRPELDCAERVMGTQDELRSRLGGREGWGGFAGCAIAGSSAGSARLGSGRGRRGGFACRRLRLFRGYRRRD